MNELTTQSWYQSLLADLKKLEFTGIVLTKWNIGKRILQDELKFGKPEYGKKKIENLAKDMNVELREVYRCIQFAKKCHTVTQLENKSWRYVINELLPEPKKENIFISPFIEGEYEIIAIDPPWAYGTEYDAETRRVASPYKELSQDKLKKIKLPAAKNSILWLWTTHKFIWEAKELMELWGFEYKAILTWNKEKMGMGAWLRMQCEFCLLGIKGNPKWEVKNLRDIISEPRREHSRKPEAFYKMIDDSFSGRKLDYFGRKKRSGWDIIGDEKDKFN